MVWVDNNTLSGLLFLLIVKLLTIIYCGKRTSDFVILPNQMFQNCSQKLPGAVPACVAPTLSYRLVEDVAAVTLSALTSPSVALVCALGKVDEPGNQPYRLLMASITLEKLNPKIWSRIVRLAFFELLQLVQSYCL